MPTLDDLLNQPVPTQRRSLDDLLQMPVPGQIEPARAIGEEMEEVRTAAEMIRTGEMPEPEARPPIPQLMGRLPGGFMGALRRDVPREVTEPQYITRLREIREGPGTEAEKDVASKLVTRAQIDERASQIQEAVQAPHDYEAFRADAQELKGKFLAKTYRRWERGSAMVVGGGLHLAEEVSRIATLGKYGDKPAEYARMYHRVLNQPEMQPVVENAFDKYFGGAVETGPFLGIALAPAALTGGATLPSSIAGFLAAYAVEGNNAYQTALDRGEPEPLARIRGISVGIINGGIEVVGGSGGKYFKNKKAAAKAIATKLGKAKTFSRYVLKNALKEGLMEELPQEAVSMVVGGDVPRKKDGTVDYDAVAERLTDSAIMGTILGGLVDAPMSAASIYRRTKQFIPPTRDVTGEVTPARVVGSERVESIDWKGGFGEGKPGFSGVEKEIYPKDVVVVDREGKRREESNRKGIVYRDEQGEPVGVLSFYVDEDGKLDVSETGGVQVFVEPEYRRQGIATKLFDLAKERGYDVTKVPEGAFTIEGAAFYNAYRGVEEPVTSQQAVGQQYGLSNEEVDVRLVQAEDRYRELKQKETTDRTSDEKQELAFLRRNRTDIESLLEWDTTPRKEMVGKQPLRPFKSQLEAGHTIPDILGMSDKTRREFMKKETGKTSMKDMSPIEAQTYIDALHRLARRRGVETGVLPQERKFKKPVIGLTPQLYKAKILGVEFMVSPAALGKQRFDLEFAKTASRVDKMKQVIDRLGGETVASRMAARLKGKPTKSVIRFAELLNKHEEAPANLTKEETKVFNYFRNLSRTIFARENAVRKELGMMPIPYRPGYMRHIIDVMAQDMVEGRHPIPEELKYWAEEHASRKIRNPMEFQRKLGDKLEGIFSNDLIKATKAMLWTGLKEIHLNKPLKFFETQVGLHSEVLPDSTRRWAEKFINHMVVGKQTATDQRLNDLVKESGIGATIDKILKPFGRKISYKPLTNLMGKAGRLQIYGVMGWRPKQLLRNKFQFFQNLALYTTKANLKSFLPASKQLKKLLSESLFLETYKGFEDLSEIDQRTLGRLWMKPFQWTAVTNAKRAMKVAYYDTLELIENSKYKKLGWADPKRTYTEEGGFLYPSERKKLLDEMEFGAGVTQYHYIPMAMPGVFNYKAATPLTRLQSWWMNYFFKFHRESANRFFTGETREGLKLPWSRRIGWGRYLVMGGLVLNTLGYTSSYLFGAAPEAMPPLGQLLINLYKYIVTNDDRTRNNAKRKFLNALKTFAPGYLAYKDIKALIESEGDLTQLLFYNKGIFKEGEPTGYAPARKVPQRRRP